jgi:hypothetical protein
MPISRDVLAVVSFTLLATPAFAQSQVQHYVAAGTATAGDDGWFPYVSAGSERISSRGLSIGADAGILFGRTGYRPGYPKGQRYRQYALSLIGGAHSIRGGVALFVVGGISFVTDPDCCGPGFLWNVGAGINYWLNKRIGVRTDGKVMLPFGGEGGILMARVGLTFRTSRDGL